MSMGARGRGGLCLLLGEVGEDPEGPERSTAAMTWKMISQARLMSQIQVVVSYAWSVCAASGRFC